MTYQSEQDLKKRELDEYVKEVESLAPPKSAFDKAFEAYRKADEAGTLPEIKKTYFENPYMWDDCVTFTISTLVGTKQCLGIDGFTGCHLLFDSWNEAIAFRSGKVGMRKGINRLFY